MGRNSGEEDLAFSGKQKFESEVTNSMPALNFLYCHLLAVGGGPSMFIQHSKDPNILFLGSMLVGRCSSCASSNTDLVWAYILNGRTVAIEDMLITEQNITRKYIAGLR